MRSHIGLHNLRSSQTYDGLDSLASIAYPNGATLSYEHDGPFLTAIKGGKGDIVRTNGFTPFGQPLQSPGARTV